MNYRPEIDGLRAVAVLPVILFHAGVDLFSGGYVGVDIFFVISGYLISSIIMSDLSDDKFTVRKFYERRARRILPALIFVVLCCLPFAWFWMLPAQLAQFGEGMISVSLFASNILFWMQSGYFAPSAELNPLLHTWSLAVEEQFYLFFPIIMMLVWRFAPRLLFAGVLAVTIASLGLAQWASTEMAGANFYLIPTRAWELGLGVLCALWERKMGPKESNVLAGLGLVLIAMSIFLFDDLTPMPSVYGLLPVGGTAMIILFAGQGNLIAKLLSIRPVIMVGLISYSAYLWHQPMFAFTRLRFGDDATTLVFLGLSIASLVMGYISWRFVERPFRAGPHTLVKSQGMIFALAIGGLISLIAIGGFLAGTKGAMFRYSDADRKILRDLENPEIGDYVKYRFNTRLDKGFEGAGTRVLVVGDSYAQDFVNVLYEGKVKPSISLSTHYIPVGCGNLLTDKDFTDHIDIHRRARCAQYDRYDSVEIRHRISQADYVIIASSWRSWEWKFLPETIAALSALTDGKVILVGRKQFRRVNLQDIVTSDSDDRSEERSPIPRALAKLNKWMRGGVPHFIDISGAICGDWATCLIYTPDGYLISHDGAHLTKAGAKFAAQRLFEISPLYRELVE